MGKDPLKEFSERDDRARQMENMLASGAEKVARQGNTDWTTQIQPDQLDFSMLNHDPKISDFTNQQLFMSNLRQYGSKDFENDAFMEQPAEAQKFGKNPSTDQLRILSFAINNHGDYDGHNNKLKFAGGGLEIELVERSPDSQRKPEGLFSNNSTVSMVQKIYDDRRNMVGFVRARFKLNHNVPHMIVNSHTGAAKLLTHELVAQKLETEGGADHFHIYASPTYQTDVLYIFTPDVLSVMNHRGADFAYKFYDNEVEVYAPASVLENSQDMRDLILTAVDLTNRINKQAACYRDDRATDYARKRGNLAPRGRRMESNITFWSVSLIVVVALFILWIAAELVLPLILRSM